MRIEAPSLFPSWGRASLYRPYLQIWLSIANIRHGGNVTVRVL